jgi:hypothetical protein
MTEGRWYETYEKMAKYNQRERLGTDPSLTALRTK